MSAYYDYGKSVDHDVIIKLAELYITRAHQNS